MKTLVWIVVLVWIGACDANEEPPSLSGTWSGHFEPGHTAFTVELLDDMEGTVTGTITFSEPPNWDVSGLYRYPDLSLNFRHQIEPGTYVALVFACKVSSDGDQITGLDSSGSLELRLERVA